MHEQSFSDRTHYSIGTTDSGVSPSAVDPALESAAIRA